MRRLFLAFIFVLFCGSTTWAKPNFPTFIPNGAVNGCTNCHSGNPSSGNPNLGPFGLTVAATGTPPNWDILCPGDSDGDGASNGLELADPDCVWTKGDPNPGSSGDVSLPGDPSSVPPGFGPSDPDTSGNDDTGGPADAGGTEDVGVDDFGTDEGEDDPDEGEDDPDEGEDDPDEGEDDPDEGEDDPDEGEDDFDTGEEEFDAGEDQFDSQGGGHIDIDEEELVDVIFPTDLGPPVNVTTPSDGTSGGGCQSTSGPAGSDMPILFGLCLFAGLALRRQAHSEV